MVKQGEIFFVNFDPSKGHEQKAYRPALALSNNLITETSGMTIVAPITTSKRNYPMYHELKTTNVVKGKVMLDQIVALDLQARHVSQADIKEKLSLIELEIILNKVKLLFQLN